MGAINHEKCTPFMVLGWCGFYISDTKHGVSKPENCKFTVENELVIILDAIEIIECSKEAKKSISEVPIWSI